MHKYIYSILLLSYMTGSLRDCNSPVNTFQPKQASDSIGTNPQALEYKRAAAEKNEIDSSVQSLDLNETKASTIEKPGNFTNIFFSDKIFSFSDYVKASKVSVFIVTASYCSPCHELINHLKEEIGSNRELKRTVNVFLLNVPKKEQEGNQIRGYYCFKEMDELTAVFPTTILFAPTKNQYAKFEGISDMEKIVADIRLLSGYCK